jgi:hypothetical protein
MTLLAITRPASACPCCDSPCTKYDVMRNLPPLEPLGAQYVAERAVAMSGHPKRAEVMKILTRVRFVSSTKGARTLRIVDAAHVPATIDHGDGARIVIVHDLAAKRGHFQMTFDDGSVYTVEPCTDGKRRATTCLTRLPAP